MESSMIELVVWIPRQQAGVLLPQDACEHVMESGAILKKPRPMSKGKKGMKVVLEGTTAQLLDAVAELMRTNTAQGSELDQWNYYKETKDGQEKYGPFTAAKLHSWDLDGWFKDQDDFVVEHHVSGVWVPPSWMWLWFSTHFTLDVEMEDVEQQVLHEISELRHDTGMQEEVHQVVDMDIDITSVPQAVSSVSEAPLPSMSDYIIHTTTKARREVLLVIDTNILLVPKPFARLNAINTLLGPGARKARIRVIAVIPYMVLMELDKLKAKSSKPEVQTSARLALVELRNHLAEQTSFFKVQSMQEFKEASLTYALPVADKETSADDRILQCCLQLTDRVKQASAGGAVADKVVLVSNDNALCAKALASDVKAVLSKQIPASPEPMSKFFNDLVGLDPTTTSAPSTALQSTPQAVPVAGGSGNGMHPAMPTTAAHLASNGIAGSNEMRAEQLLLQLLLVLYSQDPQLSGPVPDLGIPMWQARPLHRLLALLQSSRLQAALQQLDQQQQLRQQQMQMGCHPGAVQAQQDMLRQQQQAAVAKDMSWEQTRREILAYEQQLQEKVQAQQAAVQAVQQAQQRQMSHMRSDHWQQEQMMLAARRSEQQQTRAQQATTSQELTTALSSASSQGNDGMLIAEAPGSLRPNPSTDAAAVQMARQQAAVSNYMTGAFLSQYSQGAPTSESSSTSNRVTESTSTVLNRQLSNRKTAGASDHTQGPTTATSLHPALGALQNNPAAFFQTLAAQQRPNPTAPTAAQADPTSSSAANRSSPFIMQGAQPGGPAGMHLSVEAMKMLQNLYASSQQALAGAQGPQHRANAAAAAAVGAPQVTMETLQALQALQRQGSAQHPSPHIPASNAAVDPRQAAAIQALQAQAAAQAANMQRTPSTANMAEGGVPLETLRALQSLQMNASGSLQQTPSTPTSKATPMVVSPQRHGGPQQLLQPNKQSQAIASQPNAMLNNLAELVAQNHNMHGGQEQRKRGTSTQVPPGVSLNGPEGSIGMTPSRQQSHGYNTQEKGGEEPWLSQILAGTARAEDVNDLMGELVLKVHEDVEQMLKAEFDDLWEDVVAEKPPWNARALMFVLQKHWDCFKGRLGVTTQPVVVNLNQVLKRVPSDSQRAVPKSVCEDLLQQANDLLKAFGKAPLGTY